ncbi:MAG: SDR family NAD(P)-dependent oxidoreductase [Candidatus Andeanibacterium colombiense]|uniref:SDR family NAD(P)-dependent oxidoreductase n=1 Tax=Candidatus Andeanibacterium colombiense TaxID=3121345 RepID=A0AAJ5X5N4_9SPHN|nr:MAG: SDR family NAD(P)-dependent oxidoreductase [Sphingomonadaceae bacterium]
MSLNFELSLVTGASSGIGAAFAVSLAKRGHHLVLVARRAAVLRELGERLRSEFGVSVEILPADLADRAGIAAVEARLARGDVDLLINNAGMGSLAGFLDVEPGAHEAMIAVNVTALTRLTYAAARAMKAAGRGTIVNVASGIAFNILPTAAVYAATKGFVSQFTQALAEEMAGSGVKFQLLVPGLTRTNLGGAEENGLFDLFPSEMVQAPEAVAEAGLAGLELGEVVCIPRLENYSQWEAARDAIRAVGIDPPGNAVASRYRVELN